MLARDGQSVCFSALQFTLYAAQNNHDRVPGAHTAYACAILAHMRLGTGSASFVGSEAHTLTNTLVSMSRRGSEVAATCTRTDVPVLLTYYRHIERLSG